MSYVIRVGISGEWWRASGCGTTRERSEAHRYTREEIERLRINNPILVFYPAESAHPVPNPVFFNQHRPLASNDKRLLLHVRSVTPTV